MYRIVGLLWDKKINIAYRITKPNSIPLESTLYRFSYNAPKINGSKKPRFYIVFASFCFYLQAKKATVYTTEFDKE